ncbi:MAG: hypothetical protein ACJA1E_001058 [Paracoccaceae bacterium]
MSTFTKAAKPRPAFGEAHQTKSLPVNRRQAILHIKLLETSLKTRTENKLRAPQRGFTIQQNHATLTCGSKEVDEAAV